MSGTKGLPCKEALCQEIMGGVKDYSLREYCDKCEARYGSRFQSLAAKAHEAVLLALTETDEGA